MDDERGILFYGQGRQDQIGLAKYAQTGFSHVSHLTPADGNLPEA
jgi:hypothetical protein